MNICDHPPPPAGDFPKRVTLELTNKCNLNCTFCPRRLMERDQGFIDTSVAKRLLDEMSHHLPVVLVPFFRGEPLLHPDWQEILGYAKAKGIGPIQLTTNATLLNSENIERLLDLQIDFISISMDTVDRELYEKTRRGSNYHQVVANISALIAARKARALTLPAIQVSAVNTQLHRPGLPAFISFWRNKVDRVRIYIEHSQDNHPGSIAEPLPSFQQRRPCHKPFTDLVVYWNGEAAICNHDWTRQPGRRVGNIFKTSISETWNSRRYHEIRQAHLHGVLTSEPPCDFCDHWKMYYLPNGFLGETHASEARSTAEEGT